MEYYKNLDLKSIEYFCEFDLIWKTEEWRDIPDYIGCYQVSDLGRVKSLGRIKLNHGKNPFFSKEKILKGSLNTCGYRHVGLSSMGITKKRTVHQLVAIAFLYHIPNGMKFVVNHKNFIITDNRKLNLEIVTNRENANKKHIPHSSKYTGVCWEKRRNKWISYITIDCKFKFLGYFDDEKKASNAYQTALNNLVKD